jgi:hypothetical protein
MTECWTDNPVRGRVPKKRYDRDGALEAAASCVLDLGVAFSAYRCRQCGSWHVGKTPRRRRTPHADETRLLEIGARAVKAEADENDSPQRRRIGVIRGRCYRAAALAAGKTDAMVARRRRSEEARALGQLRERGWYEWSADRPGGPPTPGP